MPCLKKWRWIAVMLLSLSVWSLHANGQVVAADNATAAQPSCLGTGTTAPANTWGSTFTGIATATGSGYSGGAFLLDPITKDREITALNPAQANLGGIPAQWPGPICACRAPRAVPRCT